MKYTEHLDNLSREMTETRHLYELEALREMMQFWTGILVESEDAFLLERAPEMISTIRTAIKIVEGKVKC